MRGVRLFSQTVHLVAFLEDGCWSVGLLVSNPNPATA